MQHANQPPVHPVPLNLSQVDAELEAYHTANAELDLMIGGLRGDIDKLQEQAAALRTSLKGREARVTEFHADLHDAMARGLRSKEGECEYDPCNSTRFMT